MKVKSARALLVAVALSQLAIATPAFADRKTNNTLIGAGIGGVAGALLSHGDVLATVGGAAAGGIIGNVATRDRGHDRGHDRGGYRREDYRGRGGPHGGPQRDWNDQRRW